MTDNNAKTYWDGPHGMRVPMNVNQVRAIDGGNTLFQDGSETEMNVPPGFRPTKEAYLEKHAELREDGHYWLKGYWNGPYGIRVPLSVGVVLCSDECNHLDQDGSMTEMYNPSPPTKEEYLAKYTELREDGHYWWKSQ